MTKDNFKIENIPAILWGGKSNSVYICVHGKMSCKEDALGFAEIAVPRGYQVLSFDLPEHGERKDEDYPCMVWNAVRDLEVIGMYAIDNWSNLYLYGSSLGAYFSLLAYKDIAIKKCLFLSPVLDIVHLIENMMNWFNVSEHELKEKLEIPTPMGETLYWDYYCYAKEHLIDRWDIPTAMLYGSEDNLTEREVAEGFAARFKCNLTVLEGSEHWFHTEWQLNALNKWLEENI